MTHIHEYLVMLLFIFRYESKDLIVGVAYFRVSTPSYWGQVNGDLHLGFE